MKLHLKLYHLNIKESGQVGSACKLLIPVEAPRNPKNAVGQGEMFTHFLLSYSIFINFLFFSVLIELLVKRSIRPWLIYLKLK